MCEVMQPFIIRPPLRDVPYNCPKTCFSGIGPHGEGHFHRKQSPIHVLRGYFHDTADYTRLSTRCEALHPVGMCTTHWLGNNYVERNSQGIFRWQSKHALCCWIPVHYEPVSVSNDHGIR